MRTFGQALLLFSLLCTHNPGRAQEVHKLAEGDLPGEGRIEQMAWLIGYWKGEGLGGICDEIWMTPADGSMAGVFRLVNGGQIRFSEYMVIAETEGSLVLKLKHFSRDLTPWEEKDKWIEFRLIRAEGQTAWFDGLTYQRSGDTLLIRLLMESGDRSRIGEFRYDKVDL